MTNDGTLDDPLPAARGPERSPRTTPQLIATLLEWATPLTLTAIAVVNADLTQFVFACDDDPLGRLNDMVGTGGHPIGLVGLRTAAGAVEFRVRPFVEYQCNPRALIYLQSLRDPFLALLRTHIDRMPDDPRMN